MMITCFATRTLRIQSVIRVASPGVCFENIHFIKLSISKQRFKIKFYKKGLY